MSQIFPSISLAYESAESDIMMLPPRVPKSDKLVSFPLLFYSYCQVGIIETGICYFVFFSVYASYGISANDLANANNQYFSTSAASTFISSDGDKYSSSEQKSILAVAQGSVEYNILPY